MRPIPNDSFQRCTIVHMRTLFLAAVLAVSAMAQPYTVTSLTCKDGSGTADTHLISPGQTQTCTATLAWIGNAAPKITLTVGTVTYAFNADAANVVIVPYSITAPMVLAPAVLSAPIASVAAGGSGQSTITFTVTYPSAAP